MLAWIILLIVIALITMMIVDHNRGKIHIISARNIFLLGFIHFQLLSVFVWLNWPWLYFQWDIQDSHGETSRTFLLMSMVFLGVWMVFYGWGVGAKHLARRLPAPRFSPSDTNLLGVSLAVLLLGSVMWFSYLAVPTALFNIPSRFIGSGIVAGACGLAAWVWVRRPLNPLYLAFLGSVMLSGSLLVMTQFGRRLLLSIGLAIVWGAYYRRLFHHGAWKLVAPILIIAVPSVIVIAAFTTVRGAREQTVQGVVSEIRRANVTAGLQKVFIPQDSGAASLWIIENYPDQIEYRQLHSLVAFAVYPIPRRWWPEKPHGLGMLLPILAKHEGVKLDPVRGHNVGPGVIGHAAAEGGWYALVIYAALLGLLVRFLDAAVQAHWPSVFVVIPMGVALGEVAGIPRGETPWMANLLVMTTVGSYLIFYIIGKFTQMAVSNPYQLPAASHANIVGSTS